MLRPFAARFVAVALLVALVAAGGGVVPPVGAAGSAAGQCAGFTDVTTSNAACVAIATLVANGIITGYATNPPRFGPNDSVLRAQIAAFLVRALDWQAEAQAPRSFTDFGALAGELRASSLILANRCDEGGSCVAKGYEAASCEAKGKIFPCFGPNDKVSYAQVISFIARALESAEEFAWEPQPGGALPYNGIPAVHQNDARTYHHYAGTIPAAPTNATDWSKPAPRAWVARAIFQALDLPPVVVPPWGPTLAPLASGYTTYNDPQGRFSARVPQDWTNKEQTGAGVIFRKPGPLWGAEIALNDGSAFSDIAQVDPIIEQQLHDWLNEYVPIDKDTVMVGTHQAYRRVFQHRNVENQTEIIVRIYFLANGYLYQVNGFMLPGDRGTVEPLVDGLAGSIVTNP
ncbi:MAG: S-layer homology domain-containing protein [Chloroflexia bacterium]